MHISRLPYDTKKSHSYAATIAMQCNKVDLIYDVKRMTKIQNVVLCFDRSDPTIGAFNELIVKHVMSVQL